MIQGILCRRAIWHTVPYTAVQSLGRERRMQPLWNTVYLDRAVKALREDHTVEDQLLQHLSPLPWDHIHLTGDYHWHANKRVAKGGFRPLRQRKTPSTES